MIKAVIFDIDGTLVDSVDFHAQAWQRALAHYGKEISFADVRQQIGKGGDQLLPVFLTPQEVKLFGKEVEDYRTQLFQTEYLPQVKPFPSVRELFQRLRQDGKRIVLASSAAQEELAFYKKLLNVEDLLDGETSADDAAQSKPQPDIFEVALAKLGNPAPAEVLVVGDSPYDAEAAGKTGLPAIGLLCGGFPPQQLSQAGCLALYNSPAELLQNYEATPFVQNTQHRATTR